MNNHTKIKNWYFFAKKVLPNGGEIKKRTFRPKILTSPTLYNYEIFDNDPQFDMKFGNLQES